MKKRITNIALSLLLVISALFPSIRVKASDGPINQDAGHESETSMYLYDIDIFLENPCNSKDMDKDAVYQLWFDFDYKSDNGYGASSTYRYDMSWNKSAKKNLNGEVLKKNFIRPNDNGCMTHFSVWIPGIVQTVRVHLNMDGGERLSFTVESISLNGFRVNTGTDYVSSAYYDSNASIACRTPGAAINGTVSSVNKAAAVRDQYNGILSDNNTSKAIEDARYGDCRMFFMLGEKDR